MAEHNDERDFEEERYNRDLCPACGSSPCNGGNGKGSCIEFAKGWSEQREWLEGKSLADAEICLSARETTDNNAYNRGATAATRDYIWRVSR